MRDLEYGVGKPEALKENLSGLWSRRIDDLNRLIYAIEIDKLVFIACIVMNDWIDEYNF